MAICEVCGNDLPPGAMVCPYCKSRVEHPVTVSPGCLHRVVDLERGMPTVDQALTRLRSELETASCLGCRLLTLIHGYGSSGRGGKIRQEVRRQLAYLRHQGLVGEVVHGEEFKKRSGPGRNLIRRFPFLRTHTDLDRGNPGITLVVLK